MKLPLTLISTTSYDQQEKGAAKAWMTTPTSSQRDECEESKQTQFENKDFDVKHTY